MSSTLVLLVLLSQAEPAPPEPVPAGTPATPAPLPTWGPEIVATPPTAISVSAGLGFRLSPAADDMPPRFGLAIGTAIDHRYALVFDLVDFGVAGVFTFQRHNRDVQGSIRTAIDKDMPIDDVRQISTFEFAALQTAGVRLGPVHTWLAAGAGLAIGLFQSREVAYRPGESRTTGPVACGAAGVDIEFRDGVALGVRLDFSHRLVRRRFTPDKGEPLLVFGDHASFAANLLYRF